MGPGFPARRHPVPKAQARLAPAEGGVTSLRGGKRRLGRRRGVHRRIRHRPGRIIRGIAAAVSVLADPAGLVDELADHAEQVHRTLGVDDEIAVLERHGIAAGPKVDERSAQDSFRSDEGAAVGRRSEASRARKKWGSEVGFRVWAYL